MRNGRIDTMQISYHVLERTREEGLLPLAANMGIGVIVMEPLDKGDLVKGVRKAPNHASPAAYGSQTWGQALLAWVVSDQRVSVAIPATSRPARIAENALVGNIGNLPQELIILLGNPAACRGHITDGVSKGEKR